MQPLDMFYIPPLKFSSGTASTRMLLSQPIRKTSTLPPLASQPKNPSQWDLSFLPYSSASLADSPAYRALSEKEVGDVYASQMLKVRVLRTFFEACITRGISLSFDSLRQWYIMEYHGGR